MDFDNEDLEQNVDEIGIHEELPRDTLEDTSEFNSTDDFAKENNSMDAQDEFAREKIEEDVEDPKARGKKKDIRKLLANKAMWITLGIVSIIIFVFILNHFLDMDLFGIGNPKPNYYTNTPSCGKVYLTWEKESYIKKHEEDGDYEPITDPSLVDLQETDRFEYKEYEFDEYITGIVWNDNNDAKDVENEIVYEAMGIAARSRLIANLPNNCVVLKYYNEQAKSFKELNGSEEKYTEIKKAVADSKGMIIVRNGKAISALYDFFSYTKKGIEENETGDKSYFYHMMNENIERQQLILSDWVDKLEKKKGIDIPKKRVSETKMLESLSLYGARYLLELVDIDYNLYRILEYYYGRDIEYYTIFYYFSQNFEDSYSSECSDISMTRTMLSREEFISLAQSYANGKSGGAQLLADNAGMIYDLCVANNFNPELIFIRAKIEGYDPGGSTYNFWGIGCTNTGGVKACYTYNSLYEGVLAFIKYASKYNTVFDMMSRWAYLGKYWYNPGKSSIGGCYYAEYIYDVVPDRVKEACNPSRHCDTSGGPDCVETTEEDQEAYDRFQVKRMLQERQTIFKLGADTCEQKAPIGEPGTGSCTPWRQGDSRWGNIPLGSSSTNMSRSGCLVTSVAIAISCSGTQINNVSTFNPGTLVQKMNSSGGFSGANMNWSNSAISFFAPNFRFVGTIDITGSNSEKINMVSNQIMTNTSILLHFVNEKHPRGHWVVLKSISGDNFTVYDPATGGVNTYNASDLDRLGIYRY